MANTNPVNTNCYVLRSCTTGDDTVLVTSTAVSALGPYVGQHIRISDPIYAGICFSVELLESGCVDCSKSASVIPLTPNPICTCTVLYNYYVLTSCDPSLPSFYTAQNLYPYDGTTITFFGQGGACYTVTGSANIPQGISVIGVQCPEACQCVIPECGCPDGYILNPQSDLCERVIETTPTGGTKFYIVEKAKTTDVWGNEGAWFFDDVSSLPKPLTALPSPPPWTLVDDLGIPCIIDSIVLNSLWTTRLEVISIWAQGVAQATPAVGAIGFGFCYDFPESKIYYFGISADDVGTLAIDSNLIIDVVPFVTWTVLPIFITAGQHILNLTVKDVGSSVSGIGFEIYDVPDYPTLQACTIASGVYGPANPDPFNLNRYILFTTLQKLTPPGQTWNTGVFNPIPGENYGYNCPDGFVLNACITPVCVQISSIPPVPCEAWQITFCDGTNLDPIITSTNLDQYIAAVGTAVYTITYTDGEDIISGCGSVSKALSQIAPDFTGTFSSVFYDCCKKCTQVCYLLEDCQGAVDPIITCTDLSNYVNQIVKLSNCGDICWKVSESETCDDSILLGTVIENFVPEPVVKNNCVYEVSLDSSIVTFSSYEITINNTFYIIDYTNITALVNDLNSLNLGVFYFSGGYIGVNGLENYGTSCLVRTPKPKICTEPTCSTYTDPQDLDFAQACTDCLPPLPPEPVLDLHLRRIKPGYFSPNSCITTEYMDRINCNFAKQVYDAMLINRYGITVCCDHDVDAWDIKKQGLDFELLTDPDLCKSTLCVCPAPCLIGAFLTVNPTCIKPNLISASFNSCYPPIITSVTIELDPTCKCFVVNGVIGSIITYIDCEDDEVSLTLTDNSTYFCAKEIITSCQKCIINELPNDCALGECVAPPPVVCNCWGVTPTGKSGTFVTFTYDTCDGIPVTVSNVTLPVEMCSPASPNVIITNGTYIINSGGTCNTDCGITGIAICTCYTIEVTSNDAFIANVEIETYTTTCLGVDPGPFPITTNITSSDPILYICSERAPIISLASSNAEVLITMIDELDCATGNCVAPTPSLSECYQVNGPVNPFAPPYHISYVDSNGYDRSFSTVGGSYYLCSQVIPFTLDGPPLGILIQPIDCELCGPPPLSCVCYVINTEGPTIIDYTNCDNIETSLPVENGSFSLCSLTVPTTNVSAEILATSTPCNLCI